MGEAIGLRYLEVPSNQAAYPAHSGNQVTLYNDASVDAKGSAGAFHDIEAAINEAQHFIFVADWSFHPYMRLRPTSDPVGQQLMNWAKAHQSEDRKKPGLVAIHTWDHTTGAGDDQNADGGNIFKEEIGKPHNLLWRASSRTGEDGDSGFGWSHHQKFVVLDCPCPGDAQQRRTIRAFLGGLDLTQGRFDWPEHHFWPGDQMCEGFRQVTIHHGREIHDWYSAEFDAPALTENKALVNTEKAHPRQPWHDIHCQIMGPAAWDVVREFVGRWNLDPATPGAKGDTEQQHFNDVAELFREVLFDRELFVQQREAHPNDWHWNAQLLRSITKDHWGPGKQSATAAQPPENKPAFSWTTHHNQRERSIQDACLQAIRQAERFIYLETQYFVGSGDKWSEPVPNVRNEVPEALLTRILQKAALNEEFHVYLIIPMFPEGDPSSLKSGFANGVLRDYQWRSINYIIRSLADRLGEHWRNYFTVGFLANWLDTEGLKTNGSREERVKHNKRYMIYVHSKLMLIDDRYVILGSANLNERSLAGGRDSEICASLWPPHKNPMPCIREIQDFRQRLWAEHFGGVPEWERPESPSCTRAIQNIGECNWKRLNEGKSGDGNQQQQGHFCCWPIDLSASRLLGDTEYIIDGEPNSDWQWWPSPSSLRIQLLLGNIPE